MKNADYWRGRALILEEAAHKQGLDYVETLEREFQTASRRLQDEIEMWYARFATNNRISLSEAKRWLTGADLKEFRWTVQDYIKAGESLNPAFLKQLENASARVHISRLEALQLQLQQQIEVLYGNQLDGLDKTLRAIYQRGYYHTAFEIQRGFNLGWDLQRLNEKQLAAVLNRPWSTDAATFRDRCWKNKAELVSVVQTSLTQSIIRGDGPDRATKLIAERFKVSSNKAARLVMTEGAYFAAQSQKDCYHDLDVKEFEIVETLDGHTCDTCRDLDGAVFPMSDYEPGVTVPPFHPWCRGCTAPHFPDNYGERAARDAEGKVYYVPSTMKYRDWEKTFVDGGSKTGLTAAAVGSIMRSKGRDKLKQSILDQNKGILTETQQKELETILDGMTEDQLTLYNQMGVNFSRNYYDKKVGAAYWPSEHRVKMNINNPIWDKRIGSDMTGAWKTKFHEECHQLDHVLGLAKSPFGQTASGGLPGLTCSTITDVRSVTGAKLIKAINEDIISAINRAVDWRNAERVADGMEAVFKPISSLSRIPGDAKDSLIYWLKATYTTPKAKAQIDAFTDMVGLATENRIPLYSNGFWGHKPAYNRDRGKSGATSETFANIGALLFRGDKEAIEAVKELCPATWDAYSELFDEIAEYSKTHDLTYP